jgi:ankyrin repeat protein
MKSLKIAGAAIGLLLISVSAEAQLATPQTVQFVNALKRGEVGTVIQLMASQPGLANTRDDQGETALLIAIRSGKSDLTAVLLQNGADVNLPARSGETPLVAATRVGDSQAVDWLLGLGAKIDGANKSGETPLIVAVQQRNTALVRLFLSRGADPDRPDSAAGYSARDYALRDARARDIQKLITDAKPKPAR